MACKDFRLPQGFDACAPRLRAAGPSILLEAFDYAARRVPCFPFWAGRRCCLGAPDKDTISGSG